jgi:glucose/arabinose dehydrogenase
MNREFRPPAQELGPHVAPLGMLFYTGNMFPESYKNQILIAEHGSWNRSKKIGYRITMVTLDNGEAISYKPFIEGWLQKDENVWGRPVDLLQLTDGSVLISDDYSGTIYRITYNKQ